MCKRHYNQLSDVKAQKRESMRQFLKRNPHYHRDYSRSKSADYKRHYHLVSDYGITLDDYNAVLKKQRGRCAICGSKDPRGRASFAVDHDHNTGTIRGLLCIPCNLGIGNLNDDPKVLQKAARYIKFHKASAGCNAEVLAPPDT